MTGLIERVHVDIDLSAGFPERYAPALFRSAESCAVKKHLEQPQAFDIRTHVIKAQTVPK